MLVDVELELGISTVFWVVSSRLYTRAELLVDVELVLKVVTSAGAANSSERENESTTCEVSTTVVRNCEFTKPGVGTVLLDLRDWHVNKLYCGVLLHTFMWKLFDNLINLFLYPLHNLNL